MRFDMQAFSVTAHGINKETGKQVSLTIEGTPWSMAFRVEDREEAHAEEATQVRPASVAEPDASTETGSDAAPPAATAPASLLYSPASPPPTPFADTLPPTAAPAPAATEDMSSSESEYSEELSDDDEVKFLARGLNASVNVLDTSDSSEEYMEAGGFSQEQYFTPKKLNPKKKQAKESKREAARKPTPGPSRKQPARNGKK
ncbi:hypothetical protein SEMRO_149_G068670.1 [Seminavis robusta]|uniref:Uncharacterized protein n=1 Tax=Seminavis robusta TaxID=568900 RepID=A0A9N8H5R1_9STRA|nr:hypothetical protein SEMRO_149_G068670.1 [Seminavis robusta]|eukprot:Sro149_g068670.1 n/a (202) ;mRNA; r:87404-88068